MSERKRNEYLDLGQRYQPEKVRLVIVASRFTAGAFGFLLLIQWADRPEV
jgi:hypothetical protein